MTVNLHTFPILIDQTQVHTNQKIQFVWEHKIKLMVTAAVLVATICATLVYTKMPKPECVENFYDDWNDLICQKGKLVPSCILQLPDRSRFKGLIKKCASGEQISGCFHRNYYRELTHECKDNPAAALCDGKYEYKDFIEKANQYSESIRMKPPC